MKKIAIEIIKNINMTIKKIETKKTKVLSRGKYIIKENIFSAPTASKSMLVAKRTYLIKKYNLKENEWK